MIETDRHEQNKESEQQDELSEPMTIRKQAATVLDRYYLLFIFNSYFEYIILYGIVLE